ncbi:DUF2127 domain-containing protein (plasmid) [Thioclava litoralis]|uniref:DUF2127 domain-containing protein n=1 Tax=Thioclava litoralis TaxID=3076557 RepID=A0ABZ1E347_9RHOB|nr:DUF2127 domain-containing protein [Thioclava sp. FTW29]
MQEKRLHQAFEISVALKGIHALIEILAGLFFYVVKSDTILRWMNFLTQDELREDPRDFVASHIMHAAQGFTGSTEAFYAFYLASHGAIKLALVIGLLKEKWIAFPLSLIALGGFMAYQLYRYSYTHSTALLVLTVFDLLVCGLVWHEWRTRARQMRG